MKTSASSKSGWGGLVRQAVGLFVLSVIPLYMLAYRLMGKPYVYHWGEAKVTPVGGRLTKKEYLFYRAFPLLVVLASYALLTLINWWLGKPIPFIS
ncbi:MAG: hypothetical protein BroJett011_42230 [Chloroflexota bacterium]|nr:MAG: hypothetical protein BroJett011_42230 [Chloroflexota bacterium]